MNSAKLKMLDILKDLKQNYCATGVKAEFENEGTTTEEAVELKELASRAGLDFTIKIGGCGAIKDMQEANLAGADTVVAPMIETTYAAQKFAQSIKFAFPEDEKTKFLINIETMSGYINLNDIINSSYFDKIDGIVFGRSDMIASMNLSKEYINSDEILNIANTISKKMQDMGKIMIIGGGVSDESIAFFQKLPYLSAFETRKIIFNAKALEEGNCAQGILKALEFELLWLKNRNKSCASGLKADELRVEILNARYKNLSRRIDNIYR